MLSLILVAVVAGLPGSPWGYRTVTKVKTVNTACAGCTCPDCCANREPVIAEQLGVPQPVQPIAVNPPQPLPAYQGSPTTTETVAFKRGVKKVRTKGSRRVTCGPGGCG